MNIIDPFLRQALANPSRPALRVGDGPPITYGDLLQTVRRLAEALLAANVGRNDRVAIAVSGPAANVSLSLALAFIGAVSIGVSPGMPKEQLMPLLAKLGAHFVIHNRPADLAPDHPGFKGELRFKTLLASLSSTPKVRRAQVEPGDTWRIAISSGTTGVPKGMAYTHERSLVAAQLQRAVFPTTEQDVVMVAMHVNMAFATHYWLRALSVGACAVLQAKGTPGENLRFCHELAPTQLVTTPGAAMAMVAAARRPESPYGAAPPALRFMNIGGGKVSPQLHQALRQHVCDTVYVNYGSTETHLVALLDPALQQASPQSAGRLLPWVEAQATDDSGNPLPPGKAGALRFRTPCMSTGYLGTDGESGKDQPFRGGWFYSQDVGAVAPDGIVTLGGRRNDVINISGVKIDPAVVESAIVEDAAILDCAVVDMPGALGQPVLAAVIVTAEGAEVDVPALQQRCAKLGAIHVPKKVLRAPELPRNEAGKIMRNRVRNSLRRAGKAPGEGPAVKASPT